MIEDPQIYRQSLGKAVVGLLLSCSLFNFFLCFVHTRVFPTSDTTAMAAEGIIIAAGFAFLALRSQDHLARAALITAVLLLYFILIAAVKGYFDPKPFRDLLIAILFIALGRAYLSRALTDRVFRILTIVVLVFGLIEYLFPAIYTSYFNLLQYYIAKGATDASAADYITDGLNINGARPESQGRELLPWLLTSHRASSIFLEPVTAGNSVNKNSRGY